MQWQNFFKARPLIWLLFWLWFGLVVLTVDGQDKFGGKIGIGGFNTNYVMPVYQQLEVDLETILDTAFAKSYGDCREVEAMRRTEKFNQSLIMLQRDELANLRNWNEMYRRSLFIAFVLLFIVTLGALVVRRNHLNIILSLERRLEK